MKKIIVLTLILFAAMFKISAQTIIVYNNDTTQKKVLQSVVEKNIVTWNFSMLGRGSLVFDYERKINDYLSVMAGAGVTFMDFWSYLPMFSGDADLNDLKIKPSWAVEFSPHFFPKQLDDLDGFYIAPLFRSRNYKFQSTEFDYDKNSNITINHSRACADAAFIVGWQGSGGFFDTFSSLYFGAGCTWTKAKNGAEIKNYARPLIVLGATIGFSF